MTTRPKLHIEVQAEDPAHDDELRGPLREAIVHAVEATINEHRHSQETGDVGNVHANWHIEDVEIDGE